MTKDIKLAPKVEAKSPEWNARVEHSSEILSAVRRAIAETLQNFGIGDGKIHHGNWPDNLGATAEVFIKEDGKEMVVIPVRFMHFIDNNEMVITSLLHMYLDEDDKRVLDYD